MKPDLSEAHLQDADLEGADLSQTNLQGAYLYKTYLYQANLLEANLTNANLYGATITDANLSRAVLHGTDLSGADLRESKFNETDFENAIIGFTIFGENDLSTALGLDKVQHYGPSTIGVDVIYKSKALIPESFLRDAGLPDSFLTYARSLVGAEQPIQFYSCFISYSHKDEEFAKRLFSRLRDFHIRVWYAPEAIKGGEKLHEQIDRAIQHFDRLLLVISENSIRSEWVITEIRNARRQEVKESKRKLFPIRLVGFETIQDWQCFDADSGKDLAVEIREYFIPDFSEWKNYDAFESAFNRLVRDLNI